MPTTVPGTTWRLPSLPDPADGPDAFMKLGTDAWATVGGTNVTSYTPTWASVGSAQPANPGSKIGRFRSLQGWCDVYIYLSFSASTTGGSGYLYLTLPVAPPVTYPVQTAPCFLTIPGTGVYTGEMRIDGGTTIAYPHFPRSSTIGISDAWRSTDATLAVGTGVPLVPGSHPILPGGSIAISGRYLVA